MLFRSLFPLDKYVKSPVGLMEVMKKESKYKGNRKRERAKEKKTIERNKDKEKGEK